ncbi:diguanylate cyclase domain-containing protein, partial [Chloroflexota bacterium]
MVVVKKEYVLDPPSKGKEELSIANLSNMFLNSSLDVQEIFERFVGELRKSFDISWSSITLIFDNDLYLLALSSKIGSGWKAGERIPIKGTGTEWVAAHKKAVVESDISQESRFITRESPLNQGICSIAYLPLVTGDKTIGSLIVASCKPNAYSQSHMTFLGQLADQIAVPIKHSQLYTEVREKIRVDGLTGLLNRRSLSEIMSIEIKQHSRYGGVFSLIILDLDSFKGVNEKHGYQVGDAILRDVGVTIKSMIRNADQVFRYGSDEFAILLPNTSIEAANQVADRFQQLITSATTARDVVVTISMGLAIWPNDGLVENEIVDAAETSLHSAKQAGGNQSQCLSGIQPSLDYTEVSY